MTRTAIITTAPHHVLPARLAIGAVTALLVCLPVLPAWAQSGGSLPSAEAWYLFLPGSGDDGGGGGTEEPNPLCETGLPLPGCPGDPTGGDPTGGQVPTRVNPYPENTLHVSLNAGADDTITFLELADPLGAPGTITGGTLTLPLSGDAGTASPESAEFQACAVSGAVTDGVEAGDPATAPTVDCTASSPAVYAAPPEPDPAAEPDPTAPAPTGTFTVDLAPLASRWATSTPAVALVATDAAKEAAGSWHVAFDGRDRETEGAQPVSFTLTVEPEDEDDDTPPPTTGGTTSGGSSTTGGSSSGSTGGGRPPASTPSRPGSPSASSGTPAVPGPNPAGNPLGAAVESSTADGGATAAPPVIADDPALDAQPVSTPFVPGVGLVYPQTYFLPLIAVSLGIVVATSLIKPMRLPDPAEAQPLPSG